MAHDLNHQKIGVYLYDKIFKKEVKYGKPVININNLSRESREKLQRNIELFSVVQKSIRTNGNVSVDAHKSYIIKNINLCKYKNYLLDYELKQPDLPVSDSIVKDMYIKLWGTPLVIQEIQKYDTRGFDTINKQRQYRKDLYNITQKVLKKTNDHSVSNLVKIIERDYPVESELLLNYIEKFKHLMK